MSAWLTFVCLGLVQAEGAARPLPEPSPSAVVVIALPATADAAMVEALHRLRGEATSVGFDVRLVRADDAFLPKQLDSVWSELHPAALVTLARPPSGDPGHRGLDVTFRDRATGSTSVAHVVADDVTDADQRADVIVAVRAVDFIRARMFDTLAGERGEGTAARPAAATATSTPPPAENRRRIHVSAGLVVLGTPSGFAPAFSPGLVVGYRPARWLRVGAIGLGLGSRPQRDTALGRTTIAQWLIAAEVAVLAPPWHRVQPLLSASVGEYWLRARGDPTPGNVGFTVTSSSPASTLALGLTFPLTAHLGCELLAGTLWLQSQVHVRSGPSDTASIGRPTAFGVAALTWGF